MRAVNLSCCSQRPTKRQAWLFVTLAVCGLLVLRWAWFSTWLSCPPPASIVPEVSVLLVPETPDESVLDVLPGDGCAVPPVCIPSVPLPTVDAPICGELSRLGEDTVPVADTPLELPVADA